MLVITAGKIFFFNCGWHGQDSYYLVPSSPPTPHSRQIHLGLRLGGKSWVLTEAMWGESEHQAGRSLHQDRRWLTSGIQAASENKHPMMGQREEGKNPAPDPAAESETLIIERRPEMHPIEMEPSGTSLLGKEATSGLPGCIVQAWGVTFQVNSTVPMAPWSWRLGGPLICRPQSEKENIQGHLFLALVCKRLSFPPKSWGAAPWTLY